MTLAAQGVSSLDVLLALFGFAIFFSNLLVLLAIILSRYLHNPSYMVVAGMATADAMVGLIAIPDFIVILNSSVSFTTCKFVICLNMFIYNTSNLMVVGFTLDRLFLIAFPVKYYHLFNHRRAMVAVSFLWALGLISGLAPYWFTEDGLREKYNETKELPVCTPASSMPKDYMVYYQYVQYGAILIIMISANVYTICVIRTNARALAIQKLESDGLVPSCRKSKAQRFLVRITTIFIVCTLPAYLVYIIEKVILPDIQIPSTITQITLIMYPMNSLINPFIYAYSRRCLKTAFHNLLNCKCRDLCEFFRTLPHTGSNFRHTPMVISPPNTTPSSPVTVLKMFKQEYESRQELSHKTSVTQGTLRRQSQMELVQTSNTTRDQSKSTVKSQLSPY